MSFIDLTPQPTFLDHLWRLAFRIGFQIARAWWRVSQRPHVGALIAIHVGSNVLLVCSSYRPEWHFPGGGLRKGETPLEAARRELSEEIGLTALSLDFARVVTGHWDGRPDRVHVFRLTLDQPPALRLDNREIIAARLFEPHQLEDVALTGPVAAYLRGQSGPGCGPPDGT